MRRMSFDLCPNSQFLLARQRYSNERYLRRDPGSRVKERYLRFLPDKKSVLERNPFSRLPRCSEHS